MKLRYAPVDSSVILDIFEDDHKWADWSENILNKYSDTPIKNKITKKINNSVNIVDRKFAIILKFFNSATRG